jgi:hypothetical protein
MESYLVLVEHVSRGQSARHQVDSQVTHALPTRHAAHNTRQLVYCTKSLAAEDTQDPSSITSQENSLSVPAHPLHITSDQRASR